MRSSLACSLLVAARWAMSSRYLLPEPGVVRFVYATDPEGNVVELQSWLP